MKGYAFLFQKVFETFGSLNTDDLEDDESYYDQINQDVLNEFLNPESDWTQWDDLIAEYDWSAGTIFEEGTDFRENYWDNSEYDLINYVSYDYYYFDDADYSWYDDYWKNDDYDLIGYNYFSDDYKIEDEESEPFIETVKNWFSWGN